MQALGRLRVLRRQLSTLETKGKAKTVETLGRYGFNYGVCLRPHEEKIAKGGEDAVVASNRLLAVCDGVGGWANSGVDPADYSRGLASNLQARYQKSLSSQEKVYSVVDKPGELLVQAVE